MNEDIQAQIIKSFDLSNRTSFLNNNYLNEAVNIINEIITNDIYQNSETITVNDIIFTDYLIGDKQIVHRKEVDNLDKNVSKTVELSFSSKRKLSNIIFNIYYPKATDKNYYHYTTISALRNILKGYLKLNSLISVDNYEEFKTFYEEHNILGYFTHKDYDGTLMKTSLMRETYYFCMASKEGLDKESETSLWSSFADKGSGVRIEFEILSEHPDFRKIFYREKKINKLDLVINRLNNICKNLYERELYIAGISKIGSFYLPGTYKIENEVRFVLKRHTDEYKFDFVDTNGHILLPFKSKYAQFKIKKIKIGENCNSEQRKEIINMLKENNYSEDIIE